LFGFFLDIVRRDDPSAQWVTRGKHREARYKDALFLVKYANRSSNGEWWFGIMESHLADLATSWKGAVFLCIDKITETIETCRVQAICLPSASVIQMLAPARVYEASWRTPDYASAQGAFEGIIRFWASGDTEKAHRVFDRHRETLTADQRAQITTFFALSKEKGEIHANKPKKGGRHPNFTVRQKPVECEIKVDGVDPWLATWVDWREVAYALDRLACNV
jgi:hypothetical protein